MTDKDTSKVEINVDSPPANVVGNVEGDMVVNAFDLSLVQCRGSKKSLYRQKLLAAVKGNWLDDFLKELLKEQVLIDFDLAERKYSSLSGSSNIDDFRSESKTNLLRYIKEADILGERGIGHTVLIQGSSGAGKTITLLKLVQEIIQCKEEELIYLPVVLNLSSWKKKRQSISNWLIEELDTFYKISNQKIVNDWIANQKLFLFFDGLDEVEEDFRADCIRALQKFRHDNDITPIVIGCRTIDYAQLSKLLPCNSIVTIQPLTLPQINQYLNSRKNQLQALKTFINNKPDSDIRKLAETPLNLWIMSLAFQDFSLEDLSEFSFGGLSQKKLWDIYIYEMFTRDRVVKYRSIKHPYPKKRTINYLIWLAKQMTESSQGIFLIERLQPSTLTQKFHPNKSQFLIWKAKLCYRFQSALIFGLFMGLFGMLSILPSANLQALRIFGLLFGAVGVLIGALITGNLDDIKTVETLEWSIKEPLGKKKFFRELILGLLFGLVSGLILWKISNSKVDLILAIWLMSILGLFFSPLISFIVWVLSSLRGPVLKNTTQPNQGILNSAQNAAIIGFISAVSGFLISGLFGLLNGGLENGVGYGIMGAVIYGLLGTLTCGGSACLRYFNLRLTLCYLGYAPWNYTHFLTYATERIFMQRVGGGYKFVHGTLRKHLAEMDLPLKLL
ncbi:NACHT domain-containing protein [Acaryochloris sp. IP29b_bin.148]|uniref:NACHT domain-containing protein n=1 Tax=Acaryochloris sp. IP29b_bin.148 TaxID=2969218 RepID=UPI00261000E3|nr:NACHT domain-containing protein [Acaryochloris sp. IP29b_bin.148]